MRHPHATAPPSSGLRLTNVLLKRRLSANRKTDGTALPTIQATEALIDSSTALPAGAGAMPIQGTLARRAA